MLRREFVGVALPISSAEQYMYRTLSIASVDYAIYSRDDILTDPNFTSDALPAGDSTNVATNPEVIVWTITYNQDPELGRSGTTDADRASFYRLDCSVGSCGTLSARKGTTNQHIVLSPSPPAVTNAGDTATISLRRSTSNPIIADNDDIDLVSQPSSVLHYGARITIDTFRSVRTTSSVVYIVEFSEPVTGIIPAEVTLLNGTTNTGITPTTVTADSGGDSHFHFCQSLYNFCRHRRAPIKHHGCR